MNVLTRLTLGAALLGSLSARGQRPADPSAPVRYELSLANALHHEARITATFSGLPAGQLLRVRMARSSPGRYAVHDFAKNVYYPAATDGAGRPLALSQTDPYGWDVLPGADGTVRFSYTLYGSRTDGTYAGIDQQHAHLNLPATLCYALGQENRPAEVSFMEMPATWTAATQLQPTAAANTFTAPNLQYLMDSPVSLGPQQVRRWQEDGRMLEMSVLHTGSAADLDRFVGEAQRVVREARGVWGELPAYDFGRYTFIADFLPQADGDGMEHRNSTSITNDQPLATDQGRRNLGIVAHEFFHAWNVERLRPRSLEPFDFERANLSGELWFAEGFTQYYGQLVLRRAGLMDDATFLANVGSWITARRTTEGAQHVSAVDMSRQAPFADAAVSIDPTNRSNTYLSYYIQGAGLALSLDLQLRQRYGTDLDAFMRAMWQQFGKDQQNYAPARPYTLPDLQRVLGEVSRDTAFAGSFFRRHVYGHEAPDFNENLQGAGLLPLVRSRPGGSLARQLQFDEQGRCVVAVSPAPSTGLYQAGLDRGDVLLSLDGQALDNPATLAGLLKQRPAGSVVAARVRTPSSEERTVQLKLTEDPYVLIAQSEHSTPAQQALRTAWLASKVTFPAGGKPTRKKK